MRGRKRIEMLGRTFCRLLVTGAADDQKKDNRTNGDTLWSCRCSCGTLTEAYGGSLRAGHKKSCGCLRRETARSHGQSFRDCLRTPFVEQQREVFFKKYKRAATVRSLSWELTKKQFDTLVAQDCAYCGGSPRELHSKYGKHSTKMNGVDRIDNLKGYSKKNCVPCCKMCNFAKRGSTMGEFKNWVGRVYNQLCLEEKGKL